MLIKKSERHRNRVRSAGAQIDQPGDELDRRAFLRQSGLAAGALAGMTPSDPPSAGAQVSGR